MIIQYLNEHTINEFKSIISLLKSSDFESKYLALSLLKEYPYSMTTEFDSVSLSYFSRYMGYAVDNFLVGRVIRMLEEIIDDKKYYYDNKCKLTYGKMS